jgi:putative salt-induced outer membrane protein YdiY
MHTRPSSVLCVLAAFLVMSILAVAPAHAQAVPAPAPPIAVQPPPPSPPPPPPPGWAGSLAAGWAATHGNSDTSTINFAYELLRDAGGPRVFKSTGLYLRGDSEGAPTVDRSAADARFDYRLSPRVTAFALTGYARDRFKDIDYLVSQSVGFSLALEPPDGRLEWIADLSVGGVVEKNRGFRSDLDGALLAGERLVFKVNEDKTRFTHAATALWKMDDFDDGYYTFSAGMTTSLVGSFELKAEFLNTFKSQPTDPTLKRNDQSIVLAVVYRF